MRCNQLLKSQKTSIPSPLDFTIICLLVEDFIMHEGEIFSGSG